MPKTATRNRNITTTAPRAAAAAAAAVLAVVWWIFFEKKNDAYTTTCTTSRKRKKRRTTNKQQKWRIEIWAWQNRRLAHVLRCLQPFFSRWLLTFRRHTVQTHSHTGTHSVQAKQPIQHIHDATKEIHRFEQCFPSTWQTHSFAMVCGLFWFSNLKPNVEQESQE